MQNSKRTYQPATAEDVREMVVGFLRGEKLTEIAKRLGKNDPGFAFSWRQMWLGKKPIGTRAKNRIPDDLLPLFGTAGGARSSVFRFDDDDTITEAIAVNKAAVLASEKLPPQATESIAEVAESVAEERNAVPTGNEMTKLVITLSGTASDLRKAADSLDEIADIARRVKNTKEVLDKLKGLLG